MPVYKMTVDGRAVEVKIVDCEEGEMRVTVGGKTAVVTAEQIIESPCLPVTSAGSSAGDVRGAVALPLQTAEGKLRAEIAGTVAAVLTKPGAEVHAGDVLFTLEAMKMENEIKAPADGRVKAVAVGTGDTVKPGNVLLEFEE